MNLTGRPRNSATASEGGIAQAGDGTNIVIAGTDIKTAQVAIEVEAAWADINERYRRVALEDRSTELALFEDFLRSHDRGWWGWAGAAWAGKTRLMAELACSPPTGWRTSAFFARRGTQDNDERGFLRSVLVQLAGIAGQELLVLGSDLPAQRAQLRDLLDQAAQACADRGERLLLLVDGLDEDEVHETEGERSIAALLPGSETPCVVVVSSRPSPVLRLPPGHALADPANWHTLHAVEASTAARTTARTDMRAVLAAPAGLDAAALMAVTGHPLTPRLLASITGRPTDDFEDLFASSRGRCFTPVATRDPQRVAYVLAHASLYDMLIQRLDPDFDHEAAGGVDAPAPWSGRSGPAALSTWRERLAIWASSWADRGWPINTPDYLLHDNFLRITDEPFLVDALTDPARHARIAARFGSAAPALGQLRSHLHDLIPTWNGDLDDLPRTDLVRSARLLFALHDLSAMSGRVPANLPAVFARIGQHERAEQLAGATVDGTSALVELARAYLDAGQRQLSLDAARRAARTVPTSSSFQPSTAELCRDLARVFMTLDDTAAARAVVEAIPDHDRDHQNTVAAKVEGLGITGDVDRAVVTAGRLGLADRCETLQDAALAAHACGDSAAAERLAHAAVATTQDPDWRWFGPGNLIPTLAQIGLVDEGRHLADRLSPRVALEATVWLSEWCLHHDDPARADQLATTSLAATAATADHRVLLAPTCARLSAVLIRLDRHDDAARVLAQIEDDLDCPMHAEVFAAYEAVGRTDLATAHLELALAVPEDHGVWFTLHTLDKVVDRLGSSSVDTWLLRIIRMIADATAEAPSADMGNRRILEGIAGRLAWRGQHEASTQVLGLIETENEYQQSELQFHHAMALAAGPAWSRAAETIDPTHTSADELSDLAEVLVRHGHGDAAEPLAEEALAPRLTGAWQTAVPTDLSYALGANNRLDLALAIATRESPHQRDELVFAAGIAAGGLDLAAATAHLEFITDPDGWLAPAFAALAHVAIGLDDEGRVRNVDTHLQTQDADVERAVHLLEQALSHSTSAGAQLSPGWVRHSVKLFAHLGRTERATQLVRERMHPTERPSILAEIAHIVLANDDRAGATRVAESALSTITGELDRSQWLYFCASLVTSLSTAPAFRAISEEAAQLAWANLPPIVSEPSKSGHGQSQAGRDVSLVVEALLVLGRLGSARHLIAEARRARLDLDFFRLTPAIAVHDSAAAALEFIDSTSPQNRRQPLERAFGSLLASESIFAARTVMDTIQDADVRGELHLRLATYFADTGRPAESREWVHSALEWIAQAGPQRRGELHTWAADRLLALDDRHESLSQLRAAMRALTSEPHGGGTGLIEGLAKLASELGHRSAVRQLIATSWSQAGHPLNHWNLLYEIAPDEAAAIAESRWGALLGVPADH